METTFQQEHKNVENKIHDLTHGIRNWKLYAGLAAFFMSLSVLLFAIALTIHGNGQSDRLKDIQAETECRSQINAEVQAVGVEIKVVMAELLIIQAEADIALYNQQSLEKFVQPYQDQIIKLRNMRDELETAAADQRDVVVICRE